MYDTIHGIYLMWFGGYQASFIGKRELEQMPLLGLLVKPLESILVGRDQKDSKEERDKLIEIVKDRQIKAEKGLERPLTIFPEGCTTSGEYVIQFRRGAFTSLRGVKPYSAKTWSPSAISPNSDGCMGFI